MRISAVVAVLFLSAALSGAAAANLVFNGGFETGDFSGWTVTGGVYYGVAEGCGHSSEYCAWFGAMDPNNPDYLSQMIPTVPGEEYDLSVWISNNYEGGENYLRVWWNGALVAEVENAPVHPEWFNGVIPNLVATGDWTELKFGFWNPPGWWDIDDISVTPSVPEPASAALGGLSLLALSLFRRRRNA